MTLKFQKRSPADAGQSALKFVSGINPARAEGIKNTRDQLNFEADCKLVYGKT